MAIGILDLAIVTDQLLAQLRDARTNTRLWAEEPTPPIGTADPDPIPPTPDGDTTPTTPFDIFFTGMPPDQARALAGACKVSLYLFHVAPDKTYRNVFPADPRDTSKAATRPRRIPQQPLALTLYYLLSAHSESYVQEQQAMSIALKSFHEHPIVTATVPVRPVPRLHELTVTLETQSIDEVGRLWQAMSTSLRLSAVYRASVVFIEPEEPARPIAPVVGERGWSVAAYPQFLVSRAIVGPAGQVTVWGRKFDDAALEVFVDGVRQQATAVAPPAAGQVLIVEPFQLELQLPSGTAKGNVRLGVRIPSEPIEAVFTLRVPEDIP